MQFLVRHQRVSAAHSAAHRPRRGREHVRNLRVGSPVLVEARTVRGDRRFLGEFAAALRERARSSPGHLEEVHFSDEGDRIHLVALWRSPADLRSFVEEAHPDVLALRARSGAFPEVERVLWWSAAGAPVSREEAGERARRLRGHGPGPRAFTLASPVPAPA
ncbi:hypothetical protein A6A08_04835 [Nocardiopsis sp. TSRI0078]|uniref:DUF3291 domain-containing protein n=1 Tax=unclassified Nocardiopsis TaxID=2649073 RepID=UPI00093BAEB2|nr:DUF3291 domain-containing protein [Nocardiopsis sp. TSRI0078]OKI18941.1 hypothetical protein A6A08_04835 [Nocardiopsis sp. TSRI0078]